MSEAPHNLRHFLTFYFEGNSYHQSIEGESITLGRSDRNHLQLLHPAVSQFHLQFSLDSNGNYQLTDLASSNGTTVNGLPISRRQLHNGDEILIGGAVSAQYSVEAPSYCDAGDMDSLALVKRGVPTFESLCKGHGSHENEVALSS